MDSLPKPRKFLFFSKPITSCHTRNGKLHCCRGNIVLYTVLYLSASGEIDDGGQMGGRRFRNLVINVFLENDGKLWKLSLLYESCRDLGELVFRISPRLYLFSIENA